MIIENRKGRNDVVLDVNMVVDLISCITIGLLLHNYRRMDGEMEEHLFGFLLLIALSVLVLDIISWGIDGIIFYGSFQLQMG